MNDLEWAKAFVGCKLPLVGRRFGDTVRVLRDKLQEVRSSSHAAKGDNAEWAMAFVVELAGEENPPLQRFADILTARLNAMRDEVPSVRAS